MKRVLVAALAVLAVVVLAGCEGRSVAVLTVGGEELEVATSAEEVAFDGFGPIDSIDVSVDLVSVEVVDGSGFRVAVDRRNFPEVAAWVEGTTLKVEERRGNWKADDPSCLVTIAVPAGARVDGVAVRGGSGNVSVRGVSCLSGASVDVVSDSGAVVVAGQRMRGGFHLAGKGPTVEVSTGSGDIEVGRLPGFAWVAA